LANPSRIFFICNKEDLYRYQLENDEADKILRIILRSYSGVFTDFTRISENEIGRRSGIDSPKVSELLHRMQKLGFLEYLPHKNTPQLIFNTPRLDTTDISLSKTFYTQRKKDAFSKLESIIRYATAETDCRSRMLVAYFGEKKSENCEVCDVCLKRRRGEISEKKTREIEKEIMDLLARDPASITEIVTGLPKYKENDVLAILRWLIEESLVQANGDIIKLL